MKKQPLHSTLAPDLLKYLPAQLVPALIGFLCIPVFSRLFTPQAYGDYFLVNSTAALISTLGGWVTIPMVRFFPAYEKAGTMDIFYNTVLVFTLSSIVVLATSWWLVLYIFKSHLSPSFFQLMSLGVLVFVGTTVFKFFLELLRIKRQAAAYSTFTACNVAAASVFGLLLALTFKANISALLWGALVSFVIIFPFLWRTSGIKIPLHLNSISTELASNMAKYGVPLVVGNIAAWVLGMSDRFVLKAWGGSHDVGIYSASFAVSSQSITLLTSLFGLATGSLVYRIYEREGPESCRLFCSKVVRYYLLVCLPAVVGLSSIAKPAATILFGHAFLEGYKVIAPISFGVFFLGLQQMYYPSFHIKKQTGFTMIALLGASLAKIVLTILLVPSFGYQGAAFSTMGAYLVLFILVITMAKRHFYWPFPFGTLKNVFCAATLMGLSVILFSSFIQIPILFKIPLAIVFGAATYLFVLLLLKEFTWNSITREIYGDRVSHLVS